MIGWLVRAAGETERLVPRHHVPDGLEWLPLVGLAVLVIALVSALASRSPQRSGSDGTDDD